jgi:selenocysteine-specific elongation factor
VLRRESPLTTLGGGEVVDPWAPRVRRREVKEAAVFLERMVAGDSGARAERAGAGGLSLSEAVERGVVLDTEASGSAVILGDRVVSRGQLESLKEKLLESLREAHEHKHLASGVGRRELFRGGLLGLGAQGFDALIKKLESDQRVSISGPLISLFGWEVVLTPVESVARDTLLSTLQKAGISAVNLTGLDVGTGNTEGLISYLIDQNQAVRIDQLLYSNESLEKVIDAVKNHFLDNEELTPSDFKQITGLSRKGAIPMLEWLDLQSVTKRRGNARIMYQ